MDQGTCQLQLFQHLGMENDDDDDDDDDDGCMGQICGVPNSK